VKQRIKKWRLVTRWMFVSTTYARGFPLAEDMAWTQDMCTTPTRHILPICGYTRGFGLLIAIVSPWAENGNLTVYLERSGAALTFVKRFQMAFLVLHVNYILMGILAQRYHARPTISYVLVSMPKLGYNSSSAVHANNVIHADLTGVWFFSRQL
jgi:hypothetical protein